VADKPAITWTSGPLRPRLAKGDVHVWRADLEAVASDLGDLLRAEERERAERFVRERDRQLWRSSRGVLRALLGRYLDRDPHTLGFLGGAHGKPALLDDPAEATAAPRSPSARSRALSFNLSHSGPLALYAFTHTGEVGVDVEVARRPIDQVALAARSFGQAEAQRLEALEPAIREREFLRAWVRHEAELKCRGTGIGAGNAGARGGDLWVAELDVGSRAAAAVALEHSPRELRCWDWHAQPSLAAG
jgi:4'-phosphopantetheinyl transferase